MHIPDGFLDPITIIVTYAVFVCYMAYSIYFIRRKGVFTSERVSIVSALAAGIFAAQMLNWPIPGGTSLHFVGGGLAGILLGPHLGFLVLFIVLLVQCIVFHDGGITALGANVLNMGIVAVLTGYYCYILASKIWGESRKARLIGGFLGGWLGITLAGIVCGLEIGFSPAFPFGVAITVPVMGVWHAILGVIEGLITAFVIDYVYLKAPHVVSYLKRVSYGGK